MNKLFLFSFLLYCCVPGSFAQEKNHRTGGSLIDSLLKVEDVIKVGDITVHNLYKSQILAHRTSGTYDSLLITNKVYAAHQKLWDNCYAVIFGEGNASKFNTVSGMLAWNRNLYLENKLVFDEKARSLISMRLDSLLRVNLNRFNSLVAFKPRAEISILFTPIQGIGFGGCDASQFALELNYQNNDLDYTLNKGIPHELNHLAYEPHRLKDPAHGTALAQLIDEGFACYFTWVFFDRKIPEYEAVENMGKENWDWFLANEQELFKKLKPYFLDRNGDNPLLRNDKHQLFPDAPKTLFYWMGFRIIEAYVAKHGEGSWKDIYQLPIQEVLEKSGY